MPPYNESEITRRLEENTTLVRENNVLLKKIHRNGVIDVWLRVIWYAVLVGLPFVLYFYILEPYFEALGISSKELRVGISELPISKMLQVLFVEPH